MPNNHAIPRMNYLADGVVPIATARPTSTGKESHDRQGVSSRTEDASVGGGLGLRQFVHDKPHDASTCTNQFLINFKSLITPIFATFLRLPNYYKWNSGSLVRAGAAQVSWFMLYIRIVNHNLCLICRFLYHCRAGRYRTLPSILDRSTSARREALYKSRFARAMNCGWIW